ncbi:unnamed protein product [Spirodela intermedia]|uniref:Uncharacterized protein n=2 Tax=Spirodela intermedia TaxID=51605 RepID=A0A7I8J7V3_SPIIN|nr:unnamed protein product [Spirodela intermedia]CAA6666316.1 unnamed protein product [Spirodela intermedia]CAA7403094.1 unnamed protein product [Spirodela intermedia]
MDSPAYLWDLLKRLWK